MPMLSVEAVPSPTASSLRPFYQQATSPATPLIFLGEVHSHLSVFLCEDCLNVSPQQDELICRRVSREHRAMAMLLHIQ
eukprot:scaffold4470_cov255-Prasinococcus_capsulatus_cf.AAC.3